MKDLKSYLEFYETLNNKYGKELNELGIGILSDFKKNKQNIIEFHKKYVEPNNPKIVLCGINPGRYGAGLTGIPFVDFKSLQKLLPGITNENSEKSSKFLFSIINSFKADKFYQNFHVTNLSSVGFYNLKNGRNINYDILPTHIAIFILEKFVDEMNLVKPEIIVPIGKNVDFELTLNLVKYGKIHAKIGHRLNHPASRYAKEEAYIAALHKYLKEVH
jgi:uracil-DNA glycosylase